MGQRRKRARKHALEGKRPRIISADHFLAPLRWPKVQRPIKVDPDSSRELGKSSLSDLKEDSDEKWEACVGVDFGTTHTVVAYIVRRAVVFPSSSTETLTSAQDVEAIQMITQWPGHSKADWQVPTKQYCQDGGGFRNLRDHIESQIRGQYPDRCVLKFRYAVGAPAHWPPAAKCTPLDCAVKAGMGETAKDVAVLPELEAATIGALYDLGLAVTTGDVLMVCDAGGDSVDLCTYECTYQQGQAGILHLLTWNSTEAYGSAPMNRRLHDRLHETAPTRGGDAATLDNPLQEFEDGKCPFSGQDAVWIGRRAGPRTPSQPRPQPRMVLWNDGMPGQMDGIQEILDAEVKAILGLVSKHIEQTQRLRSGIQIKMLLLLGRFGQNTHLIQELTEVCKIQVLHHRCFKDVVAPGLALHLMRDEAVPGFRWPHVNSR